MRARWARHIAYLTGLLVALLAAAFAWYLNAPGADRVATDRAGADHAVVVAPPATLPAAPAERDRAERGRVLFGELGCADCHALAGRGNPMGPLDTVAATIDDASIREWIIAGPSVEKQLPRRALARKKEYRDLSSGDLDALVEYLKQPNQRSRPGTPPSPMSPLASPRLPT